MDLTTNELIDIYRTYKAADNNGVGSGNDEYETQKSLLKKIKEELKRRGAIETCGYCNQPLYVEKNQPEFNGKKFCFGRCKDLWESRHVL